MRTLVLALTVLLFAAPVWATVTITLEDLGEGKIAVNYSSDEAELIRAFALDLVATDGNIIDVNDYAVGDDNGGYGIFPGSFAAAPIQVDPGTGLVVTWDVAGYSPVAPAGDPDALGGIGTDGVTIEMGSLYDTAAPSQTEGMLCTVTVDENVTKLCVTANAIRGNVVLESAAEVQNLVMGPCWEQTDGCQYPSDYPGYDFWVANGKPDCWCYPRNCHGDADGLSYGSIYTGIYYVGTPDLGIVADAWMVKEDPKGPGIITIPNGLCADFDREQYGSIYTGLYRVGTPDLGILADSWMVKEDPKGPGIAPDCVPEGIQMEPAK
jgi:hypothetical protein